MSLHPLAHRTFRAGRTLLLTTIAITLVRAEEPWPSLESFRQPPAETRPVVWWRFMDDYATRSGITAEIASFKTLGVGGVVLSFCSGSMKSVPPEPKLPYVPILSPGWWDLVRFQISSAAQAGLPVWYQACPGYATSGGPWITAEQSMQKVVWSESVASGGADLDLVLPRPAVDPTWNQYRDIGVVAFPTQGQEQAVTREEIQDLSAHVDGDGRLRWHPGPGSWTIVRFGHTTTGVPVHPVTEAGKGLECDKLSRTATKLQYDQYFKRILAQRPEGMAVPVDLFYDSWEAQNLTWTAGFREAFQRQRGYDPLPWLVVATGRPVGSRELSRRFDLDWKTTIEDLITTEHFAELARLAKADGCRAFRGQPYNGPIDFMRSGACFDLPEAEFWHGRTDYGWWSLRMIASVGHVYGKRVVTAEALTSMPADHQMDVDPFATKAETDLAFTMGINRLAIHTAAHNPWPQLKPGMTSGFFPPLVGAGQVWSDLAGSWFTYLARCSHLLEQGTFVADYVTQFRPSQKGYAQTPGYANDLCPADLITDAMSCENGILRLPSGMQYRLLELVDTTRTTQPKLSPSGIEVLPGPKAMPQSIALPLLRKVRDLVRSGACVVGPRPRIAEGLRDYPASDAEVARIAEELWGPAGRPQEGDRTVGKGRVFTGMKPEEALQRLGIQPDVTVPDAVPKGTLPWIHRRIGTEELYFLSNQRDESLSVTVSFRVAGLVPELWHADTGTVTPARAWTPRAGRTEVTLDLERRESVFIRFRPGTIPAQPVALAASKVLAKQGVEGPWKVAFDPAMGGPAEAVFPTLVSWTDRPESGIRGYSGIATYTTDLTIPEGRSVPGTTVELDLGEIRNLARVTLQGTRLPELWKPPFRCDVTGCLKPGPNRLTVEVVNLWVNRLVADEAEPADITWAADRYVGSKQYCGRPLASFPAWLIQGEPRPSQGRRTFTTWTYVKKNQALLPAGLLGPVTLTWHGP